MPDFVRVKCPDSGAEYTTNNLHAEASGLVVLDKKDATDSWGRPIPPKYPVTKGGEPVVTTPNKEK